MANKPLTQQSQEPKKGFNFKYSLNRLNALEAGLLVIIAIVTILFRVLPYRYGAYLTAFDPLFQFRATEYIAENGFSAWGTWHDLNSWYPMGRDVPSSAYPGVPFTAAFVYHLVNTFGLSVSVHDVSLFFPIFMAVLTCIGTYFLGKDVNGKATGFFSALFLAINPPFIGRTAMGFFDTENIGIFCMVTISLFFLRSIDKSIKIRQRLTYSVLSGLSLGYIYASWGAARYMSGLLALFMIFLIITNKHEIHHLISYIYTIGIGYLIVIFVPRLGSRTLLSLDSLISFGLIVIFFGLLLFKEKIDQKLINNLTISTVILTIIGIFLLPAIGVNIPITYKFLSVLNPFTSPSNFLYQSIAENHVLGWASFFNDFGIIIVFSLLGCYFILNQYNEKTLYILLFFLTSLYFAGVMSRLSQILAAPACILGAYGIVEFMKPFMDTMSIKEVSKRQRKQISVFGVNKLAGVLLTILLALSILPNIENGLNSGDNPTSLASSSVSARIDGEYPKDWPDALDWIEANVSDTEIICSWWDYGYWITAMTGKTTMADGATQSQNQISNIGKIMMLPPNQSLPIIERYGADYLLVFYTADPETGREWPFGDNVKWQWMVNIGGLNITDYVDYEQGRFTATFAESTLAILMYDLPLPDFIEQVFVSENGFVKIFKII
jgi:dolichyl-diphosphooligosaccharide--protein glycosyltransferase